MVSKVSHSAYLSLNELFFLLSGGSCADSKESSSSGFTLYVRTTFNFLFGTKELIKNSFQIFVTNITINFFFARNLIKNFSNRKSE